MTAEPLLMGADIGTTNVKVVAFDRSGRAAVHASMPTPTHYPRPGQAHYDPEQLWQVFAATLRKVTGQLDNAGSVASIAVASMGEAAVPLDAAGRPTHDIIAWFDGRAPAPGRVAGPHVRPGSPLRRNRPLAATDLRPVQIALAQRERA
jgi:sugar (pentulose or hexulose) kinase